MRKKVFAPKETDDKYLKHTHIVRMCVGTASMLVLSIMVGLMYWYDFDILLSLVMMGCWAIAVPAIVLSMAAFARGCRLHTRAQWLFFVWFAVLVFFAGVYMFVVYPPLSGGMTTMRCMEDNYDSNRIQFRNVSNYVERNVDRDTRLALSWDKGSLSLIEVGSLRRYSPSTSTRDSLLALAGLTPSQYDDLRSLVDKCDCVDIETLSDGIRLGFRRIGYGEYFYFLPYEYPYFIHRDIMYDIVSYNDSVFFEYAGGDDGIQEFPPEVKNHYLRATVTPPQPTPEPTVE